MPLSRISGGLTKSLKGFSFWRDIESRACAGRPVSAMIVRFKLAAGVLLYGPLEAPNSGVSPLGFKLRE